MPVLQRRQSSASYLEFLTRVFSLMSPTSCIPLIPRLSVPYVFPFLPRFRRQSLRTLFFKFKPYLIIFLQISSPCIFKLKECKTVSGYCQTQQYDPILQTYHLHCVAPCSEFCKDGLMIGS